MPKSVLIVGAGPCGLLTAYFLAKRISSETSQYIYSKILIVERGENLCEIDPKKRQGKGNYGLVLSHRALQALDKVGLKEDLIPKGVLYNRLQNCLSHDDLPKGLLAVTKDYKLSMDRDGVAKALIEVLKRDFGQRVTFNFSKAFVEADFQKKIAYFIPSSMLQIPKLEVMKEDVEKIPFDILIGADGAHSRVIDNLRRELYGVDFKQSFASEPFISTFIPFHEFEAIGMNVHQATMYSVQSHKKNANLVIIPSQGGLGVSLIPNCQLKNRALGSLSPPENSCFHTFKTPADLEAYLTTSFLKLGSILNRYISPLVFPSDGNMIFPRLFYVTAEASQYHHPSCPVIALGDAVHSMPPYVGQGINAAFEDIEALDSLLDDYGDNWDLVPERFTKVRQPQGAAVLEVNSKYVRGNFTFTFAVRLILDFFRNYLSRKLPQGWVQPSVIQLLSQTSMPYSEILAIREQQFFKGCVLFSSPILASIGFALYRTFS
ncbi:hypothetical protein DSO57_1038576 [Entomophthora muscae]|uniref:Uncharacterized protein n=1 Tax=Entomophthora muscae TaxID=34485 RepID=A0ACC2S0M2_9FUNG|nr:hypothetical protein DSO57_1038576 [Entomophthora muscae]